MLKQHTFVTKNYIIMSYHALPTTPEDRMDTNASDNSTFLHHYNTYTSDSMKNVCLFLAIVILIKLLFDYMVTFSKNESNVQVTAQHI